MIASMWTQSFAGSEHHRHLCFIAWVRNSPSTQTDFHKISSVVMLSDQARRLVEVTGRSLGNVEPRRFKGTSVRTIALCSFRYGRSTSALSHCADLFYEAVSLLCTKKKGHLAFLIRYPLVQRNDERVLPRTCDYH